MRKKKACKGKFYNVNYLYTLSFLFDSVLAETRGQRIFPVGET